MSSARGAAASALVRIPPSPSRAGSSRPKARRWRHGRCTICGERSAREWAVGVAPHIAELCINHVKGGVEAIYDRHKYQREIKAALALWADHVQSIVEGSERKVVPLRAGHR